MNRLRLRIEALFPGSRIPESDEAAVSYPLAESMQSIGDRRHKLHGVDGIIIQKVNGNLDMEMIREWRC